MLSTPLGSVISVLFYVINAQTSLLQPHRTDKCFLFALLSSSTGSSTRFSAPYWAEKAVLHFPAASLMISTQQKRISLSENVRNGQSDLRNTHLFILLS